MSISSDSVSVTASPAEPISRSPPGPITRSTVLVRPEPDTMISSPGLMLPPAIVPQ